MRIPHTINSNTLELYKPSEATLSLLGEVDRRLKSEDFGWDEDFPPSLITWSVYTLAANFEVNPVLDELVDDDRDFLLESLPTDVTVFLTVPLIPEGIYWRRCCEDKWKSMNYAPYYDFSWKRMYLERYVQDYLEKLTVEEYNEKKLCSILELCSAYVFRLNIRQLQVARPVELRDTDGDECSMEGVPTDHINLEPVFRLLQNLQEIRIVFEVRECGMGFTWNMLQFSKSDCKNIGKGLDVAQALKVFRIHRSNLDDVRACMILQHLVKNGTLMELDLNHCKVADNGAMAVAKVMLEHPSLEKVKLCNNRIGPSGARGLAYALQQTSSCPLARLDLRMNPILDEGVEYLCSGLVHGNKPIELNLASCGIGEVGIVRIAQMLQHNTTLYHLDLSNNNLGEVGGEALEIGMSENDTVCLLDLRTTNIPRHREYAIRQKVRNNYEIYHSLRLEYAAMERPEDVEEEEVSDYKYDVSEQTEGEETETVDT